MQTNEKDRYLSLNNFEIRNAICKLPVKTVIIIIIIIIIIITEKCCY